MKIGEDTDGATDISLNNLLKLKKSGKNLTSIIYDNKTQLITFFFDKEYYVASGFSIGYSGTGPHGLWKAIQLWHYDKIDTDFYKTDINHLDKGVMWRWTPNNGFQVI